MQLTRNISTCLLASCLAIREDGVIVQPAQSQQRSRNFDGKEIDDDYVISS